MNASARLRFSTCALALAGAWLLGATVIARPLTSVAASFSLLALSKNKQPRGEVPGRRRGGARRGSCPETSTPLVALTSATEVETETLPETYVGGVTTAEYPTFWFEVPYELTNELTAEFTLQNNQGQDIYRITSIDFSTSEQTPGMVGVPLSTEIAPLEIGQIYQWYFKLNCGSEAPLYVQGGIERVALEPALANQLEIATPLEQATLYRENGIWYDAVTVLAPLYRAQPNDPTISAAWRDLLRSLGL